VQAILPVVKEALANAHITLKELEAVAVATRPGLVGSLLIGLTAAKSLAWGLGIPLVAIDHLQAHIYACQLATSQPLYPCVGFVVSGGHTNLYHCPTPLTFKPLGGTIDDAAGEAFDKVAQILNLGYPGGPVIEAAAKQGDSYAVQFPQSFLHDDRLDFSFSGLKTAVLYAAHGTPGAKAVPPSLNEQRIADLAASFQRAVVEVLVAKAIQAMQHTGETRLAVGGGVAANKAFRTCLEAAAKQRGFQVFFAPLDLCTDNAAMGGLGWEYIDAGQFAPLDLDVTPGLVRLA
jgi:N6-L-threonylcarbamoyladenine synthase